MDEIYDCVVVGGGAAGLNAAIALGRARRRTLLVDAGRQSNLAAHGIGGLLGHDQRPAAELYATGRRELAAYPAVEIRDGEVSSIEVEPALGGPAPQPRFHVELAGGSPLSARRILLAGGMDYRYPDIPGLAERWGGTVFHCPFCHGWEVRERPLAVLSDGAIGVHQASLLTAWSDQVTLLSGGSEITAEQREQLTALGVHLEQRPVSAVHGDGPALSGVELEGGDWIACEGLLVRTSLHQRSTLAAELGVAFKEPNPMSPDAIAVDPMTYATSVPGVSAAGDVLGAAPSVAGSIASGGMAAAMIISSLALER